MVAISALMNMTSEYSNNKLHEPASIEYMTQALMRYNSVDKVPNVTRQVDWIIKHWDRVIKDDVAKKEFPGMASPYNGLRRIEKITNIKSYHIKKFISGNVTNGQRLPL